MTDQPGLPGDADTEAPRPHAEIAIERGKPTDHELAALVAVLGTATGATTEPLVVDRNLWGHPVDKLRYSVFSWQRVTLLERTHLRR